MIVNNFLHFRDMEKYLTVAPDEISRDGIRSMFNTARIFIIDTSLHGHTQFEATQEKLAADREEETPLDLPFRTCYFEYTNSELILGPREAHEIRAGFLMVHEVSFNDYMFVALDMKAATQNKMPWVNSISGGEGYEGMYLTFKKVTRGMLDSINDSKNEVGQAKGTVIVSRKVFNKTGKVKEFTRPRDIIIIKPKTHTLKDLPGVRGFIEYSHRFEVRGHWRRLPENKIGKDREENYCIKGYTWVSSYVKGPEDAVLIKKKRIVTHEGEKYV